MIVLPRPCVCLVTDRRRLAPEARTVSDELTALEAQLETAIEGGVDLIQLRERDVDAALLRDLASRVVARAGSGTRLVVNDRADVALAAGAAGVHLRGDAPPARRVHELGPEGWLVGRSAHSIEDVVSADADYLDYLIFGTVFPSASKSEGSPVAGLDGLRTATSASSTPVLAIGGVTLANVTQCRNAGAAGIAAIGLFVDDPRAATQAIKDLWTLGPLDQRDRSLLESELSMPEIGEQLKVARLQKGVTLREIATNTKISVAALEALERSDYSRLPGGIFSRAFVRAYALAVDVEPESAVNDFLAEYAIYEREAERNKKSPEITPDDRQFAERQRSALRTLRIVMVLVGLAVLGALAYGAWWWSHRGTT